MPAAIVTARTLYDKIFEEHIVSRTSLKARPTLIQARSMRTLTALSPSISTATSSTKSAVLKHSKACEMRVVLSADPNMCSLQWTTTSRTPHVQASRPPQSLLRRQRAESNAKPSSRTWQTSTSCTSALETSDKVLYTLLGLSKASHFQGQPSYVAIHTPALMEHSVHSHMALAPANLSMFLLHKHLSRSVVRT